MRTRLTRMAPRQEEVKPKKKAAPAKKADKRKSKVIMSPTCPHPGSSVLGNGPTAATQCGAVKSLRSFDSWPKCTL